MKNNRTSYEDDSFDYEPYEERKGKIKKVRTDVRPKREIKNWKKAWSEHTNDYDEREEFYGRK